MKLEKGKNQECVLKAWPQRLGNWNYIAELNKNGEKRLGWGGSGGGSGFGHAEPEMPLWLTNGDISGDARAQGEAGYGDTDLGVIGQLERT